MINQAMIIDRNMLNDFTYQLKVLSETGDGSGVTVQLRNGTITKVIFFQDDGEMIFRDAGRQNVWHADGSSCNSSDLDILFTGTDIVVK